MKWRRVKDEPPPKDGTSILIYVPPPDSRYAADIAVAHWEPYPWHHKAGAWVSTYGESGHDEWYDGAPTHWMPRPAPPEGCLP